LHWDTWEAQIWSAAAKNIGLDDITWNAMKEFASELPKVPLAGILAEGSTPATVKSKIILDCLRQFRSYEIYKEDSCLWTDCRRLEQGSKKHMLYDYWLEAGVG
jgi:hypothetical protein